MKANRWSKLALGALTVLWLSGQGLSGEAFGISCGDVIGPNVSVTLATDLTCATSPAIKVVGPAELNLGLNTVTCVGPTGQSNQSGIGIQVEGKKARVHNGEVRGCRYNVEANGVENKDYEAVGEHRIENIVSRNAEVGFTSRGQRNRFEGNFSLQDETGFEIWSHKNHVEDNYAEGVVGIGLAGFLTGANETRVVGNTARGFDDGFFIGGRSERVSSNSAEENETGFRLGSMDGARAEGNIATNNEVGFLVDGVHGLTLYRNTAQDNDTGFTTSKFAKDTLFEKNTALGNGFGFSDNGFHNRFRSNTAVENDIGFYVFKKAVQAILDSNTAKSNASHGIAISGEATMVSKNLVQKNGQIGIWVTQDRDNRIIYNKSNGNGAFDMKDLVPGCGTNLWALNTFGTSNQACIE